MENAEADPVLLDTWFKDNIFGIRATRTAGDGAFVVFSSMGFYPVTGEAWNIPLEVPCS